MKRREECTKPGGSPSCMPRTRPWRSPSARRSSPVSLYDAEIASMEAGGGHNQTDAEGFLRIAGPPLEDEPSIPLLTQMYGFSLHAGTMCEAHQRPKLERPCRYITRPPIATKRLTVDDRGRVVYRYKRPFRDGSTHVVLEPLDFMARLAALAPRPRLNLTRFHGIFAPNFKHRHKIVPRQTWCKVDDDKPLAPMTPDQVQGGATTEKRFRHQYRELPGVWRQAAGHRLHAQRLRLAIMDLRSLHGVGSRLR